MSHICLLALCGLPAAGKTNFSKLILKLSSVEYNIIHICFDNYLNINNKENKSEVDFKKQREVILKLLDNIVKSLKNDKTIPQNLKDTMPAFIRTSCSNDYIIIYDDNNYYRSMRYKLLQFCRQHQLAFGQIYFNITLKQSLKQNSERNDATRIPEKILIQMAERLEPPITEINSWESKRTFILDIPFDNTPVDMIVSFLKARLQQIEQPVPEKNKIVMPMSQRHELDILLRRRIKELLQNVEVENKINKFTKLNDLRHEILKDFRKQQVCDADATIDYEDYLNLLQ